MADVQTVLFFSSKRTSASIYLFEIKWNILADKCTNIDEQTL